MPTLMKIDQIIGLQFPGPDEIIVPSCRDTEINTQEAIYCWEIVNLKWHKSSRKKGVDSSQFKSYSDTDDACQWQLSFYPNGIEKSIFGNCAVFLKLHSSSKHATVYGKFKIYIVTASNGKPAFICKKTAIKKFERGSRGWGFSMSVEDERKIMMVNKIRIHCEIEYSAGMADPFTNIVTKLPLSEGLERLSKNEEFTDVVLSVNGKEYKAHRAILVARSPVFAAMFKHENTKESIQNKIEITDFDESVVEEILSYIYTGKAKNLGENTDGILIAAEKYGLDGLKDMCEGALIENISIENAVDTMILADMHQAIKLRSFCIDFIVLNSAKVMKTDAWKNVAASHSKLIKEVCEGLSDYFCALLKK